MVAASGPGIEFETVFIPDAHRGTLCVSSQVGCTLNCRFCHTGTQKLVRNLTQAEIVGQVMVARDALGDWPSTAARRQITLVDDGHGRAALQFREREGCACDRDGRRRIGALEATRHGFYSRRGAYDPRAARRLVRRLPFRCTRRATTCATFLCPSTANIHSRSSWKLRAPIPALQFAAHHFRICDAQRRERQASPMRAISCAWSAASRPRSNLIPFNPWPGAPYECSPWERIEKFAEIVNRAGYASPVRTPRGRDIMAACGQLKSESVRERASARHAQMRSAELARMPGLSRIELRM